MDLSLPLHTLTGELRTTWRAHNAFVLIAPTGSGKSTQIPQLLDADGRCAGQRIVVLQPRRVAARSVAARVAVEMDTPLGGVVGYQVRHDEKLSAETRIAYITEGILLRWLRSNPTLEGIGAVILDEFHERSLLSDMALALCRRLQRTRPDLLLIVMSATLDAAPVAEYLGCPVLESQGRMYPVEIQHTDWDDPTPAPERAAAAAADILRTHLEGDVLVFMPGMAEITQTIDNFRTTWRGESERIVTLPLHGEMAPREQDRVFAPSDTRRVIVATNVAETSLTIPGVRYVVDSGLARIARYDPERAINTLHIEPIAQASAAQRAGRAGRVAPGICRRLWSARNHATRPLKNTPEIARTELSSALLMLYDLGINTVTEADFLDHPEPARLAAAEDLLRDLHAIEADETGALAITEAGRSMAAIPVHPRHARMLLEAVRFGCVREAATMAALASGRDLLMHLNARYEQERLIKRNRQSLIKRNQTGTDYFLRANALAFAVENRFDGRICHQTGVNAHAARECAQTLDQLLGICEEAGLDVTPAKMPDAALGEALARCHLSGFLDHLAVRAGDATREYDLTGGRRCELVDESVVAHAVLIVASEVRSITTSSGGVINLLGFASEIYHGWVRDLQPPGLVESVEHGYDRLNKRVAAGRVLTFHDLILGAERIQELDPEPAALVLADALLDQLARHTQWAQIKGLLARHPKTDRTTLRATIAPALLGESTMAAALKANVLGALRQVLEPG